MNQKSKITKFLCLGAVLFVFSASADAQPGKFVRVGLLMSTSITETASFVEAFRHGMRELGYIEGKNLILDIRGGEAEPDRLSQLAAELVGLKPDVIVAGATFAVHAAKNASSEIPIVMRFGGDPVRSGLATSLARPGGNITGLASVNRGLIGKRFELLLELAPGVKRVAVLSPQLNAADFAHTTDYKEIERGAKTLDVALQVLSAPDAGAIDRAFLAIKNVRPAAAMVVPSPIFVQHRERIIEHAAKTRLATIYPQSLFVDSGGLVSYGADFADEYRRLAIYADKILKGAKPADLPIEQPTKFELVINLKTAKQIGLTIPPHFLARADRVIR
jgi:putative ABC transport system substrate-binding protein